MAEQKRAWLYGRIAHDDGITLVAQMDLLRHWAAEHGYAIVGEIAETGVICPDRPGLSAVMQTAREKRMNALVVRKLGRLTRNPLDACELMETLKECGICLICTGENFIPDLLVTRF